MYQDTWMKGRCIASGYRECASRYEIIRTFCTRFPGRFTVCDIGANMCYFGIRLTEDFPQCHVMAFECACYAQCSAHVRRAKPQRLMLFKRKLNVKDVDTLAGLCRFDVVLAFSVLHHVGGKFTDWTSALCRLGKNVIIEFVPPEDSRARPRAVPVGYAMPEGAVLLGHGTSHINEGAERPIVLLSSEE